MRRKLSKTNAQEEIKRFFERDFTSDEMRKIKRLAMKFNIKLGYYRKRFCKKCLSQLKGEIRITKNHKTIVCGNCGCRNKLRIS